MHGEGVRGGGGGERELHLGEAADPLPHLLPGRHGLAGPVEGARDEVSDLVLPLLSLPEHQTRCYYSGLVMISRNTQSMLVKIF